MQRKESRGLHYTTDFPEPVESEKKGHNLIIYSMITVGITGGIGSGKTTLCRHWETRGARIVYADDLAKKLMVNQPELVQAIREEFGDEAYRPDGSLNRSYLAEQVFQGSRVDRLNQLVHPAVHRETDRLKKQAQDDGVKIWGREAALLLQNGRPDNLDYIVLVLADEQMRINRVIKRDQKTPEDVEARIRKQQNFSELTGLADFIIENNSNINNLLKKADKTFDLLMRTKR